MRKKILIVDDSPFIRRILKDWFSSAGDFEVVGSAENGRQGWDMAVTLRPDVITLDVEMPIMDGLECLQNIMRDVPTPVIMVSSVTRKGATQTIKALELGAVDFVTKPDGPNSVQIVTAKDEILEKARAAVGARFYGRPSAPARPTLTTRPLLDRRPAPAAAPAPVEPEKPRHIIKPTLRSDLKTDKVVIIASSTGGPRALTALFSSLPKGFPAPILIVQHMPQGFTESFAKRLDSIGTVPCQEAREGERIIPGLALIAPGGRHMIIKPDHTIGFTDDPQIHGVRPAADYLFKSAAAVYGSRCLGAVLTGMGKDGAQGALEVLKRGGLTLGESEKSCVIYGMPKAAKDIGAVTEEFPIEQMAGALVSCLSRRNTSAA